MGLFLLSFILIYGGVHGYAYVKLKQATVPNAITNAGIIIFFVAMVLAPVLVRVAEHKGLEMPAMILAYLGYFWMGLVFLFFSASIAIDLFRLVLVIADKLFHQYWASFAPSAGSAFYVPAVLAMVISLYGLFEARSIRTERLTIATAKLPAHMKKLVLVQISDLHLGVLIGRNRLSRVVAQVAAENPDLVVSTGDLVDGQLHSMSGLVPLFRQLTPPLGKYAITGNHEFYAGLPQALSFTGQAGFKLLRNESTAVAEGITIAGVDDPAARRGLPHTDAPDPDQRVLSAIPRDHFILLLKHRPVIDAASLGLFDLQLSGHIHKGQIFPFNLLTHLFYPVKTGLSVYPRQSALYVSRGTGTWGPPIRFLAPPEITVITLVSNR